MTEIKEITNSLDLYQIRHDILWQHKAVHNCGIKPDELDSTFHIGAIDVDGRIVGTSTFIQETNPKFDQKKQYRLRAMATYPSTRGQGLGKAIIQKAIEILKEKEIEILWCDARLKACGFYEKLNFKIKGDIYEVPQIGPHKLMFIKL